MEVKVTTLPIRTLEDARIAVPLGAFIGLWHLLRGGDGKQNGKRKNCRLLRIVYPCHLLGGHWLVLTSILGKKLVPVQPSVGLGTWDFGPAIQLAVFPVSGEETYEPHEGMSEYCPLRKRKNDDPPGNKTK